jgi:hypothetical protein
MRRCDGDGDCRAQYSCEDLGVQNPWGAEVMEYGPTNGKVCIVPYQGAPLPENPNTGVCTGSDAGAFDVTPYKPDTGATGAGSDGGDAGPDASGDAADAGSNAGDAGNDAADGGSDAATDA